MANVPLEAYDELERAAEEAAERELVIEGADDFISNAVTILISTIVDLIIIAGVTALCVWIFGLDPLGILLGLSIFFFVRPFFRRFSKHKVLYANDLGDYFVSSMGWFGIIVGVALLFGIIYGLGWLLDKWLPSYAFLPTLVGYILTGSIVVPPILGDIRNLILSISVLSRFKKNGIVSNNEQSREYVAKVFERQGVQDLIIILAVVAVLIIGIIAQIIQVNVASRAAKESFDPFKIPIESYVGGYILTEEDIKNSEGGEFGEFNETYTAVYNFVAVDGEFTYKVRMTAEYKYNPYKKEWRLGGQGESETLIAMDVSGTWEGEGRALVLLGDNKRQLVVRFDKLTLEEAVGYYSLSDADGLIHESTFKGEVVTTEEGTFEIYAKFDDPEVSLLVDRSSIELYYDPKTDIVSSYDYGGEFKRVEAPQK